MLSVIPFENTLCEGQFTDVYTCTFPVPTSYLKGITESMLNFYLLKSPFSTWFHLLLQWLYTTFQISFTFCRKTVKLATGFAFDTKILKINFTLVSPSVITKMLCFCCSIFKRTTTKLISKWMDAR